MQPTKIKTQAQQIKLLALDVDGVLTDGSFWFGVDGEEYKRFNTQDGYGLVQLQKSSIEIAIISGRKSHCVNQRMAELNIQHVLQGHYDKLTALENLCQQLNISLKQVAYMGDDTPDLAAIHAAGLGIAVANATPDVLAAADWKTTRRGGDGAVREVCDLLLTENTVLSPA
ncbi:MAG: HAD-IIIA family hydrolase [Gammaproteobacteria bacterium]|nr:HAD-IIIA family hydrolase [Gammaproteobacteria bacterium]